MHVVTQHQRTEEWYKARLGKLTASNFAVIKNGGPKSWTTLMATMLFPRQGSSYAMRRGNFLEDRAIAQYELRTGFDVRCVGFVLLHEGSLIGASPDGLVGEDGGIEVKCPLNQTYHLECFENGVPEKHLPQIQGNIWVCGAKWWDFVSYDPRCETDLYVERVYRDDEYIADLERKCRLFLHLYKTGGNPFDYWRDGQWLYGIEQGLSTIL